MQGALEKPKKVPVFRKHLHFTQLSDTTIRLIVDVRKQRGGQQLQVPLSSHH